MTDEELYKCIGQNIRYYRHKADYTQGQLADMAQISISYLSKIEADGCEKSVSISTLNQIARVLNINIDVFFRNEVRR